MDTFMYFTPTKSGTRILKNWQRMQSIYKAIALFQFCYNLRDFGPRYLIDFFNFAPKFEILTSIQLVRQYFFPWQLLKINGEEFEFLKEEEFGEIGKEKSNCSATSRLFRYLGRLISINTTLAEKWMLLCTSHLHIVELGYWDWQRMLHIQSYSFVSNLLQSALIQTTLFDRFL